MAMVPVRPIEVKPMSLKMLKRIRMMQQQQQQHPGMDPIKAKTHSWNPYTMADAAATFRHPAGPYVISPPSVAMLHGKSLEELRF